MLLTSVFLVVTSFFLWCVLSIKYVFYQDYLSVKGGPFRSRIAYESITKVSATSTIFSGYRLLSSRDAIEISYTIFVSVKVSLRDQKEQCPNARFQE
ncbi:MULTISPECIES: PH domain-containing protein [Virgibacillus]|uniref:PH domain-containing protein n=1 Tax=Virgibacillus TaxID=84406 RepID=UPI000989E727|nr:MULTISPECIES: PH domain-containing protein [Virgibacillus]NWO12663.1 PH domain-containing protein [Virgibacillus sp.]